jgi:hypothetical protein
MAESHWKSVGNNKVAVSVIIQIINREQYIRFSEHVATKIANKDPNDSSLFSLVRLIKLDIPRTFPNISDICEDADSTFYTDLARILEA